VTAYDARGNRIYERNQDSTREMTYDAEGRLLTVDDIETGRTITYGYDAAGNRKSMSVSTATRQDIVN
jgi:YD repeat-containing protein